VRKLVALRTAINVGLNDVEQGRTTTLTTQQDLKNFMHRANQRAAAAKDRMDIAEHFENRRS
jgi:hypothetical protein